MTKQEAIDLLDNLIGMIEDNHGSDYDSAIRMAIDALKNQPEVIRCKDCKWWDKQEMSLQGRCSLFQMYPTGEWYCGNAKLRSNSE